LWSINGHYFTRLKDGSWVPRSELNRVRELTEQRNRGASAIAICHRSASGRADPSLPCGTRGV